MRLIYCFGAGRFCDFFSPAPCGEGMDYLERIEKLDAHLAEHPKDYQAVIARLKTVSDGIEHQRHMVMTERMKKVAEYRRRLDEKSNVE